MKRKTFLWLAILLLLLAVVCALVAMRMGLGGENTVSVMVQLGLQRPDPAEVVAAITVPEPPEEGMSDVAPNATAKPRMAP